MPTVQLDVVEFDSLLNGLPPECRRAFDWDALEREHARQLQRMLRHVPSCRQARLVFEQFVSIDGRWVADFWVEDLAAPPPRPDDLLGPRDERKRYAGQLVLEGGRLWGRCRSWLWSKDEVFRLPPFGRRARARPSSPLEAAPLRQRPRASYT